MSGGFSRKLTNVRIVFLSPAKREDGGKTPTYLLNCSNSFVRPRKCSPASFSKGSNECSTSMRDLISVSLGSVLVNPLIPFNQPTICMLQVSSWMLCDVNV